jgi:hypothetical protein
MKFKPQFFRPPHPWSSRGVHGINSWTCFIPSFNTTEWNHNKQKQWGIDLGMTNNNGRRAWNRHISKNLTIRALDLDNRSTWHSNTQKSGGSINISKRNPVLKLAKFTSDPPDSKSSAIHSAFWFQDAPQHPRWLTYPCWHSPKRRRETWSYYGDVICTVEWVTGEETHKIVVSFYGLETGIPGY